MILITGGAGFIGSNFVLEWLRESGNSAVNLDKLTYAGNLENLASLGDNKRHIFVRGDICDRALVEKLLAKHQPSGIVHFAAESHVDRSIHGPADFVQTNIEGTFILLEAARAYWDGLKKTARETFRFLHVSTDEVYGSLGPKDPPFAETKAYEPNSPYAASKAAADHLVRAYHQTYGLPVFITNCSNNYGPYQFPEKLIPLVIANALAGKPLPIYGDGMNVRDWLYVSDHCAALRTVFVRGNIGETYNIGGSNELANLTLVKKICALLDELHPKSPVTPHEKLITFVKDRPGHDRRYSMDSSKIRRELGWKPVESFETGIRKTVQWYLENAKWVANVQSGGYRDWIKLNYGDR